MNWLDFGVKWSEVMTRRNVVKSLVKFTFPTTTTTNVMMMVMMMMVMMMLCCQVCYMSVTSSKRSTVRKCWLRSICRSWWRSIAARSHSRSFLHHRTRTPAWRSNSLSALVEQPLLCSALSCSCNRHHTDKYVSMKTLKNKSQTDAQLDARGSIIASTGIYTYCS